MHFSDSNKQFFIQNCSLNIKFLITVLCASKQSTKSTSHLFSLPFFYPATKLGIRLWKMQSICLTIDFENAFFYSGSVKSPLLLLKWPARLCVQLSIRALFLDQRVKEPPSNGAKKLRKFQLINQPRACCLPNGN